MNTNIDTLKKQQAAKTGTTFPDLLPAMIPELEKALPRMLRGQAERFGRIALTAWKQNKSLRACEPRSILACVVQCAQLGLEPNTLGQAYLIPYNDRRAGHKVCTLVPGWQGYMELMNRTGRASAWTGAVYKGDEFEWSLGDKPGVVHRPAGEFDEELLTHVYAIGRINGSDWPIIEVWPVNRVFKHRDRFNKVGKDHYSYKHFEMYARKVVLLQVLKYLPKSQEMAQAVLLDEDHSAGRQNINWEPGQDLSTEYERIEPDDNDIDGGEPERTGTQADATPPPETEAWPRRHGSTWVDSAGEEYNEAAHAWSDAHNMPAVKADGTFRARRGAGRRQAAKDVSPKDATIAKLRQAGSVDDLDTIIDGVRGDLSPSDYAEAVAVYNEREKELLGDPGPDLE